MEDDIEPVAILPAAKCSRKALTNWNLCLICQNAGDLSTGTPNGIQRLKEAFEYRLPTIACNDQFSETLVRLQHDVGYLSESSPKWHRSCYGSFTSKTNIQRVLSRCQDKPVQFSEELPSSSTSTPLTRNIVQHVDWNMCIFCQKRKREPIHQVMSMQVQSSIHQIASVDYKLKCRIGDNDLIAYEAHYHSWCKSKASKSIYKDVH